MLIGILGFAGSILFDSITFFIASLLISHLKIKRLHKDQNITGFVETNQYKGNYKKDLIDGIKFILRHRTMGKLVLLVLLINISSLVGPLYIILVNEQFKGGPTEYGIFPPRYSTARAHYINSRSDCRSARVQTKKVSKHVA